MPKLQRGLDSFLAELEAVANQVEVEEQSGLSLTREQLHLAIHFLNATRGTGMSEAEYAHQYPDRYRLLAELMLGDQLQERIAEATSDDALTRPIATAK